MYIEHKLKHTYKSCHCGTWIYIYGIFTQGCLMVN